MAYYLKMRRDPAFRQASQTLIETRRKLPMFDETFIHLRMSGKQAHDWVRRGGHHETPLWVDGTRIRYAKENS